MKSKDVDELFSETCKLSRDIPEVEISYLFAGIRDLQTSYGRRIQLAANYELAARSLRERAAEFDQAAREMRARAEWCKVSGSKI